MCLRATRNRSAGIHSRQFSSLTFLIQVISDYEYATIGMLVAAKCSGRFTNGLR